MQLEAVGHVRERIDKLKPTGLSLALSSSVKETGTESATHELCQQTTSSHLCNAGSTVLGVLSKAVPEG